MKIIIQKQIEIYVTKNNKKPFIVWLEALKDKRMRYRVKERLDRLSLGNLGDHKFIGKGVYELRLGFGGGYRIYYGEDGDKIILLLCAGNKSTQSKDIKKAMSYWKNYLLR